jgi:quercetin dioxygenase-like cupin family protein
MQVIHDHQTITTLAESANFTGHVWRTDYLSPDDPQSLAGVRLQYEPGARSFWHVHDREQAIIVIAGHGLVSWEGLEVPHLLGPGDWWEVSPGVPHWHGATPGTPFAHVAVTAGGGTFWRDEVSGEQYAAAARLASDTLAKPS